ncbi:Protein NMUR-2 [Aphelenchoides avenae]|nr:Protein NMUR-2 [Aphelenchus avenae]
MEPHVVADCAPLQYVNLNITEYVYEKLGERCVTHSIVVPTVVIYVVILILGVLGNLCTCLVILKNKSMQNPTNYYLFSLAISDLLMLVLGLPMELYGVVDVHYPYRFGEFVCKLRAFLIEFTSYASILTITCFSIERWLAICFPLRVKMFSTFSRAVKVIITVWVIAFVAALPVVSIVVLNRLPLPEFARNQEWTFLVSDDNETVLNTDFCAMDISQPEAHKKFIYSAFFLFFLLPGTSSFIKSTDKYLVAENAKRQMRGRKGLLKVLVAVVVMFFLSWLPFHVQRLLTVYLNEHQAQLENLSTVTLIFNSFFYFSGYCYYSNSCCNPILYNILSEKYRRAFSRTILGDKFASRFFNSRDGSLQLHHMPGNVHRKQTIATPCSGASTMPQHLRPKLSVRSDTVPAPSERYRRPTPRRKTSEYFVLRKDSALTLATPDVDVSNEL